MSGGGSFKVVKGMIRRNKSVEVVQLVIITC